MNHRRWMLITIALMVLINQGAAAGDSSPERAAQYHFRVVQTFPHDPRAFTQGLLFHAGWLYESTGQYGHSTLRRVELESGRILDQIHLPDQYFGEGLTLWENYLIQLTWREGTARVYDEQTLKLIRTHAYNGEGWGVTTMGAKLVMSDGSSWLRYLEPATFRELRRLQITEQGRPLRGLNELEWINERIWANVFPSSRIVIINPHSGMVEGWLDGSGLMGPRRLPAEAVLNGIAYDASADRIFITGKLWPLLFEIALVSPSQP